MTHAPDIKDPSVYFDAALRPHRSLDRTGFLIVMTLAVVFGFTIGVGFMLIGAWPVLGFCGAEILLLYIAFRINYRSGQWFEHLVLSDDGLLVRRYGPRGEVGRWEFEPSWLRIYIDEERPHGGALTLSSHGRSLAIGGFLTPGERSEVAAALQEAIAQYRRPPKLP
ncbi:MAG: DUF2244 domain-containing protein [Rhodospirillaceae bacterium]|jgi:uncharacterized membrane protein|nr:DUF2244 domain-containing protein [Rhodospirillaceae bacterium]MBT5665921.1 DUF2244 domain-containing protein [Rhodospirillaceae bacterium]MBT5809562.1 DUF2244 domain-containing protein [Rhodospirillaceae bacterium]